MKNYNRFLLFLFLSSSFSSYSQTVYVVGTEKTDTTMFAKLWKNGKGILLDTTYDSEASGIYVSGKDVYVAGKSSGHAVVWKNGVVMEFAETTSNSEANAVFVSGSDVYVVGRDGSVATLWQNGKPTNLSDGTQDANAYSVYVLGKDIYVAGFINNEAFKRVAKLWKNGVATDLTDGKTEASAGAVFVTDQGVYLGGYIKNEDEKARATLWQNTGSAGNFVAKPITDTLNYTSANSIYVVGGNVYSSIYTNDSEGLSNALTAKNNTLTTLSKTASTTNSIFVFKKDVYLAGYSDLGLEHKAAYWKNGVVIDLSTEDKKSEANGIFVSNDN
jgi:hypothetical protein